MIFYFNYNNATRQSLILAQLLLIITITRLVIHNIIP